MTILTEEQIDELTYDQCRKALKQLAKDHPLEIPWHKMTKEQRSQSDLVGNMLLGLEDRIRKFEDSRYGSMDPNEIIIKEPKIKAPPKKLGRRFRINDDVYADVHEAAQKTGIKVNTLRTYVTRKPEIYGYLD